MKKNRVRKSRDTSPLSWIQIRIKKRIHSPGLHSPTQELWRERGWGIRLFFRSSCLAGAHDMRQKNPGDRSLPPYSLQQPLSLPTYHQISTGRMSQGLILGETERCLNIPTSTATNKIYLVKHNFSKKAFLTYLSPLIRVPDCTEVSLVPVEALLTYRSPMPSGNLREKYPVFLLKPF